jgi:Lrp/AsnC family leucine-responsive transcriptional regulator
MRCLGWVLKGKGEGVSLDRLDYEILRLLQENAKLTYSKIGSKLGVAHSTVYDHIQRMEKQGIIQKYEAIVNLEKIGVQQITALMTITADPKETERIAKNLAEFNEVLEVATSFSEELVITAKVTAKDQAALHSFIAKSVAPLSGVLRIRTAIFTQKIKEKRFMLPSKEMISGEK